MTDVLNRIDDHVKSNKVIIFMKGTPQLPQCGFSSRAADMLKSCGKEFAYFNVIADMEVFESLPQYADWPTFPQLYVNGELIGGHDIMMEMHQSGDLQKLIDEVTA